MCSITANNQTLWLSTDYNWMPFRVDYNSGYPSFIATYDHNGNRLTKTQNGQTDTYHYQANASNSQTHTDELLSVTGGIIGSKTYGYDANGVARTINANGNLLFLTPDAEDRYTRFDFNTGPGAGSAYSTAGYNGAGLRTFYHDVWGGNHSLQYDGTAPGASLLSDSNGSSVYTPGVAQTVTCTRRALRRRSMA